MLKKLAEYISEYYNWLDVYSAMVVFEYDRIMKIMFVKNYSKFNLNIRMILMSKNFIK